MTTTPNHPLAPGERELGHTSFSRLYRGQTHYDFINRWKIWFCISGAVIVLGLAALSIRGLNFSIDFRGGTVWEVPTHLSPGEVKTDLGSYYGKLGQPTIVTLTNRTTGQVNIEVEASSKYASRNSLITGVTTKLADVTHVPQDEIVVNAIGPSWGSAISDKAIEAVVVFLVLISIAISLYFESKMAIGALVALLHDMLVTVGIYALSGFQVSPDTVIAFLTVLGYSLYDTIVVFDKVKENTRGLASTNRFTYTDVVNVSMNQVLARSVNTSFVAIMPVFCILVIGSWIMGATALNDFGLALFIGLMSGAYSSIFIASPILALLKEREPRYSEIRRKLALYPQARQYLSPSTVAGGHIINRGRPGSPVPVGSGLGPEFSMPDDGELAGSVPARASSRAGAARASGGAGSVSVPPGAGSAGSNGPLQGQGQGPATPSGPSLAGTEGKGTALPKRRTAPPSRKKPPRRP